METNNKSENEEEEQQEIIKPSPSAHHKFMMDFEASELENSRATLWRWLFSYLKPFRWKFSLYLILLIMGTIITASTPLITANIIDKGIIGQDIPFILHRKVIDRVIFVVPRLWLHRMDEVIMACEREGIATSISMDL